MSLKTKVVGIILGILVILGIVNWGILRFIMLPGFLSLERDEAIKSAKHVERAINREVQHLDSLAHDWAAWDDTCAFVESRSADYVQSNLTPSVFKDNNLNIIAIYGMDGHLIWKGAHHLERASETVLFNFFEEHLPETHSLLSFRQKNKPHFEMGISGIIKTPAGPMAVSSRPILTSNNLGPIRGYLILGYLVNERVINDISDRTQVDLTIIPFSEDPNVDMPVGLSRLFDGDEEYLIEEGPNEPELKIYSAVSDIEGNTVFIIKATLPRPIMEKGFTAVFFIAVSLLATMVAALTGVMLLMQKVVLKPIAKLTNHVMAVGRSEDYSKPPLIDRQDEIGILGREFNGLMTQLGKRSHRLEELNSKLTADIEKRQEVEAALRLNEARLETQLKLSQMTKEPLKKIADFALEEAVALTGSEVGFLAFLNDDETEITIYSMSKTVLETCAISDKELVFSVDKTGLWGETVRQRRPVVVNDYGAESPLKRGCPAGHVTINRYMSVPVLDGDKIVAMAGVGNKRDEYNDSDVRQLSLLMQGMWLFVKRQQAEEALRASEEKLVRSKKMESLGLLAGGVAHDLNNVLSGIVSYPELILMDLPEESKLRKPLETMHTSGKRAVAIVQDLLTVARGVAIVKQPMNLNDIVEKYLASPEHQKLMYYHSGITINTELDSRLLNIKGASVHIGKSLMNLVSNAAEAIEGNGNIIISTENRYLDTPLKSYEDVTVGEYAVLEVSDSGPGISSIDLERIFEPFYTKKVMGRSGTGLGLAIVWNVMQEHNGYIDVNTGKKGTSFELYFPITREKILEKDIPLSLDSYKGNGEKILVVDDMENQREIFSNMLAMLSYEPIAASSGEKAMEFLQEHTVDLVILDMIMDPGIGGRETYERMIQIHPGLRAIIVSGFAETDDVKRAQQLGAGQFLKKPVQFEKLGQAVKKALER